MYHRSRSTHRWVGAFACLFLLGLAITGFFLATKGRFGWLRPPVAEGLPVSTAAEIVSIERAVESAFAVGLAELRTLSDVDRVDYRPGDNVFKVLSKEGYHEVQVCGKSAKVLSVSMRRDQLIEDLHDLSFFGDAFHEYGLPVVATGLALLSVTGVVLFSTPFIRRWRFRRKKAT